MNRAYVKVGWDEQLTDKHCPLMHKEGRRFQMEPPPLLFDK